MSEQFREQAPGEARYSREEIEAMIQSPGQLALERVDKFGELLSVGLDFNKFIVTPEQKFRELLHRQELGYYDEFALAMHDTDDGLKSFLTKSAEEYPWHIIVYPELFQEYLEPDKLQTLKSVVMISQSGRAYKSFASFCYATEPDMWETAANKVYSKYGVDRLLGSDMLCLIANASIISADEKRTGFSKCAKDAFFWQGFDIADYLKPDKDKLKQRRRRENILPLAVEAMRRLMDDGVLNQDIVLQELNSRIYGSHPALKSEYSPSQYQHQAIEAKLILTIAGILDTDKSGSVDQQIKDFIGQCQIRERTFDLADSLISLVRHGYYELSEARTLVKKEDEKQHTHYTEYFDRKIEGVGESHMSDSERLHNNYAAIEQLYEKYITNRNEATKFNFEEIRSSVLEYDGPLRDKAQEILLAFSTGDSMFVNDYFHKTYERIFAGNPEGLRKFLRNSVTKDPISVNNVFFSYWEVWAEPAGYSRQEVEALYRKKLNAYHDFDITHVMAQGLDSADPFITREECADRLAALLQEKELGRYDNIYIVDFCKSYLGTALTKQKIIPKIESNTYFLSRLESDKRTVLEAMTSKEMHDIYANCFSFPNLSRFMEQDEINEFVNTALSTLPTEHLSDVLPFIWDFMPDDQKEAALKALYANPPLLAMTMQSPAIEQFRKELRHDRMLPSALTASPMESLAPKAVEKMFRRLASKILPHDVQLSRTNADTLAPEYLEIGRRNILVNYAYYGDLSHRLCSFKDADKILAQLRGKNTGEQTELRTLELMILLHESAGFSDAPELQGKKLPELEEIAMASVLAKTGVKGESARHYITRLRHEGIDIIKYGTWLHTSYRSKKLKDYLGKFVSYQADGHSVTDWKFDHPLGNNLSGETPAKLQESWRKPHSETLPIGGNKISFSYAHDLQTVISIGSQPVHNCLHYAYGLNQHAVAGLLNADVKILNLTRTNRSRSVGNAILRIGVIKNKPIITIESLYTNENDKDTRVDMHRVAIAASERYAQSLGLDLRVAGYDRFAREMQAAAGFMWNGNTDEPDRRSVLLMPSLAPFSYNDATGVNTKKTAISTIGRE